MFRFGSIKLLPLMVAAPLFIYAVSWMLALIIMIAIPVGIFTVAYNRRRRW